MRRLLTTCTIALAFAACLAGCDGPVSPEPLGRPPRTGPDTIAPRPDTTIVIGRVGALTPGSVVVVRGNRLDRVASLVVDGAAVALRVHAADSAEFTMPVTRACDVDGRQVTVAAEGRIIRTAPLVLGTTLRLSPGESRVLRAEELACLQLAAAAEDYVLSAASLTREKVTDTLLKLVSVGAAPPAARVPGGEAAALVVPADLEGVAEIERGARLASGEPFDTAYRTAVVGDSIEMVDFSKAAAVLATTRDSVPTYWARVIAVSAGQLVAVDLRTANAARFDDPQVRARFQGAAEIADRYMLRAVRAVIEPSVLPGQGAGGRVLNMVEDLPPGLGGTISVSESNPSLRWSSDMWVAVLSAAYADATPEAIASTMIHEAAHLADLQQYVVYDRAFSTGWFAEALAVCAEDVAARMALGAELGAPASRIHTTSGVPGARIAQSPSFTAPTASPWGPAGSSYGAAGPGSYDRGARILRFAMEEIGQAGFEPPGPTLYQRLQARALRMGGGVTFEQFIDSWNVDAIAREGGTSTRELLTNSMLADLTDDLVAPAAAAAHELPQIGTWDHTPSGPGGYQAIAHRPGSLVWRDVGMNTTVTVPAGGYTYYYIPGDGRGLTLQASELSLAPHHEVRLTRLK